MGCGASVVMVEAKASLGADGEPADVEVPDRFWRLAELRRPEVAEHHDIPYLCETELKILRQSWECCLQHYIAQNIFLRIFRTYPEIAEVFGLHKLAFCELTSNHLFRKHTKNFADFLQTIIEQGGKPDYISALACRVAHRHTRIASSTIRFSPINFTRFADCAVAEIVKACEQTNHSFTFEIADVRDVWKNYLCAVVGKMESYFSSAMQRNSTTSIDLGSATKFLKAFRNGSGMRSRSASPNMSIRSGRSSVRSKSYANRLN